MRKEERPPQLIQSLDRALDLLERLVEADEPLGVTELGQRINLHKSTVYRLLATLKYRGYVEQEEKTNDYRVGLKLFEIGSMVLNKMDLRQKVKPYLEKLMLETRETVHLGILDQHEVVYIDKVESLETIRMYSQVGRRVPVHCTSLGKVLLAYSPRKVAEMVVRERGLPRFTEQTIVEREEFLRVLEGVQKQGYAVDDEEQELDIRCLAGPIFNYDGQIIAAFSISGPISRMTEVRVKELAEVVVGYSDRISAAFGYRGR